MKAFTQLCHLIDQETNHSGETSACDTILKQAMDSQAVTFRKRATFGLKSGRGFLLPNAQEQVHETTDLVTWLVIKEEK